MPSPIAPEALAMRIALFGGIVSFVMAGVVWHVEVNQAAVRWSGATAGAMASQGRR
jgi:hypothetical protein